jgi:hypothetical protein
MSCRSLLWHIQISSPLRYHESLIVEPRDCTSVTNAITDHEAIQQLSFWEYGCSFPQLAQLTFPDQTSNQFNNPSRLCVIRIVTLSRQAHGGECSYYGFIPCWPLLTEMNRRGIARNLTAMPEEASRRAGRISPSK